LRRVVFDIRRTHAAWVPHALLLLAVGFLLVQVARTIWVSDDAFITLRTADNLVHGFGPRWNVAERVQTFTHPLWLALLVPVYAVLRDPYYSLTLASVATTLALLGVLVFRSRLGPARAAGAIFVLALSNAFVDYSTSGLENPLTHLLVLLFVLELTREEASKGRILRLGLLGGLIALNRLDLILLVAPALAFTAVRLGTWRDRAALVVGFAPLVIWELFAAFYYGSLYPNTTLAKLQTGVPSGELAAQGVAYLANSLAWDPLTLVVTGTALLVVIARRDGARIALVIGIVLYLAAVVKVGGDFMSGRFLTGPFVVAVAVLAASPWRRRAAVTAVLVALALSAAGPRPNWLQPRSRDSSLPLFDAAGIADERRYYLLSTSLFNGVPGWTRPTELARFRGADLRCGGAEIAVEGAVGVIGFFAGPSVHIVDYYGLGDPLLARMPMVSSDPLYAGLMASEGIAARRSWRVGHFLRNVPPGYLATVLGGRSVIEDRAAARLYDEVALLARAPLLAEGRLWAVLRRAWAIDRPRSDARPAYTRPDMREIVALRPDSAEVFLQKGQALYEQGRYSEALAAYRHVLERCASHFGALLGAGLVSLELRDHREAERFGRTVTRLVPGVGTGHVVLSFALRGQRRLVEAAAELEEAARVDPKLAPEVLALLGEVWVEAGDVARARDAASRSLMLDPSRERARKVLAGLEVGD
jgi:arabinofuranosyltransferase